MPVKHLAVDPVTVPRETSLKEIAQIMKEKGIGDVIIEENGKPVGIVTDRDVTLAIAEHDP
ncbi:MAG: CBS domain-containing protein, partial [Halobacteriaceae archaeon]